MKFAISMSILLTKVTNIKKINTKKYFQKSIKLSMMIRLFFIFPGLITFLQAFVIIVQLTDTVTVHN